MRFDLELGGEEGPRSHGILAERVERFVELAVDGHELAAEVTREDGRLHVDLGESTHTVEITGEGQARIDGHRVDFRLTSFDPGASPGEDALLVEAEGRVVPPMPGKIIAVHAAEGDEVEAGDVLATLEAMKMQTDIEAPRSGHVLQADVAEGDAVEDDQVLFAIGDPDDE